MTLFILGSESWHPSPSVFICLHRGAPAAAATHLTVHLAPSSLTSFHVFQFDLLSSLSLWSSPLTFYPCFFSSLVSLDFFFTLLLNLFVRIPIVVILCLPLLTVTSLFIPGCLLLLGFVSSLSFLSSVLFCLSCSLSSCFTLPYFTLVFSF